MKNHQEQSEASHGSLLTYTIGFVLSIVLTLLAYSAVSNHALDTTALVAVIVILAIIQLKVQLIFFLHLGRESSPRWNLITLLFALMVVLILVFGSLWIMHNLNYSMTTPDNINTYILQQEAIPK